MSALKIAYREHKGRRKFSWLFRGTERRVINFCHTGISIEAEVLFYRADTLKLFVLSSFCYSVLQLEVKLRTIVL